MTSPFQRLMTNTGFPQLLRQLGESVVRQATTGNTTVSAIVIDEGGDEQQTSSGMERVRLMTLQVASSQTVAMSDKWVVRGQTWQAVDVLQMSDSSWLVAVRRTDRNRREQSPEVG